MNKQLFVFCALLILTTASAAAIGITPPQATISFAPGYEGSFDIIVTNHQHREIGVDVTIEGELGRYFEATSPRIRSRSTATSTISFALPEDITPGEHRVRIVYEEDFFDPNEGMIAARTAVVFTAKVWKPYPGRYAEIELVPRNVPAGQNTDVQVIVNSRGDQPVRGDVTVRIYDASGRLVDSEVLPSVEIAGDTTWRRFVQIQSRDYAPGRYTVQAQYDYGSARAEKEATFIIGVRDIDLLNVTRDFYLDVPVNPFSVEVESLWNEHIEGVEASMQLGSSTGRTPTINLASFTKKPLDGFWTTDRALSPGTYNALVTVTFRDGEPVSRSFPVTVHEQSPQPPQEQEPASIIFLSMIDIIFLIIVLIIVGVVVMRVYGHHKGDQIEV